MSRKQTGSYYTPRAVVDYMVDESLLASLAQKSAAPDDGDDDFWRELGCATFWTTTDAFADARENCSHLRNVGDSVVHAIAATKVLDPAVGSGAFPMGILHKLTLALRRLDPDNTIWESLQKELAGSRAKDSFDTPDQSERDTELREISDTFEKYRDSDFGRKLYLIQNSIYGVDIQPVATQIAKLRFFISLAIEQESDPDAENYGIKPLPNLETRFVAANTLLGIGNATQIPLGGRNEITELNDQLRRNRERHFHAGARSEKLRLRKEDARLRRLLKGELRKAGMSASDAGKVAQWDPYDQNSSADWFDVEYMFSITDGYDVVIGNPPYIQLQKNRGEQGHLYKDAGYKTFVRTGDIYQLFYERGCDLLTTNRGILTYITSNSWLKAEYGKTTRRHFSESHTPLQLLELGKDVFESAIVDSCVLMAREGKADALSPVSAVDLDRLSDGEFPPAPDSWGQVRPKGNAPWSILSSVEQNIMDKVLAKGTHLKDWGVTINFGIKTGYNKAFIIDTATKDALVAADLKSSDIIKPLVRGRDIQRYQSDWAGFWLIDTHNGYNDVPAVSVDDYPAIKARLRKFYPQLEKRQDKGKTPYNLRSCAYHENFTKEKLIWLELVTHGRFAYDDSGVFCDKTAYIMTGECIKYICAVLNTNLISWYFRQIAPTSGMGTLLWGKTRVERIPIPKITPAEQRPFIQLVDRILEAKAADPDADTSDLEESIDWLVYDLYDLTDEETAVIADYFWDGEMSEEEEDAAMVKWIQEGTTGEYVSREVVMETLRNPNGN